MKGDFTRDTFDPAKHFTRVLIQQGRVQLDADWNEQVSIILHYLQALADDLIGPFGGPADVMRGNMLVTKFGFRIDAFRDSAGRLDLRIGPGRYYVNGILCENETGIDSNSNEWLTYYKQPDSRLDPQLRPLPRNFLVYLDVWERLITYCDDSSIREVALGGRDTAARAKMVWQVKVEGNLPSGDEITDIYTSTLDWKSWVQDNWPGWVQNWQPENRGLLRARAKEDTSYNGDVNIVSPLARYRGVENQLYRVEVHRCGAAWDGTRLGKATAATFKWSRDNGSTVFPIRELEGEEVQLENLGRDDRLSLQVGDWVEVVDDSQVLNDQPGTPVQVQGIDPLVMRVHLKAPDGVTLPSYPETESNNLLLRRWDYRRYVSSEERDVPISAEGDGALLIEENQWFSLEDGIQIFFAAPNEANGKHFYRTGDYWLIPARTATGNVEWPSEINDEGQVQEDHEGRPIPKALPPRGETHHYAPLAVVIGDTVYDLRRSFSPLK